MVTLTPQELQHMQDQIDTEQLPKDAIEKYFESEARNVFGHNYWRDSKGEPVIQGVGSAYNQTRQSIEAYRRAGKDEPDFEKHLARMEQELAVAEKRRAKERADAEEKRRAEGKSRKGWF